MVIGIVGKSGAGKNFVANYFEEQGFVHVDLDLLGHRGLILAGGKIREVFGEQVIAADGQVDRKALGSIVFVDEEKLRLLESIVFPEIKRLLEAILAVEGVDYVIMGVKWFEVGADFGC
ncbi:MAG: dephospho-CoA kinase, partial [Spirochaetales bacterium]|nr:dephospho-CoA kinase [Spirochaetales bacterium]